MQGNPEYSAEVIWYTVDWGSKARSVVVSEGEFRGVHRGLVV